ncbi:hypothetical protein N7488_001096 [Penicillium malachiteum]|nr:hypothetical protein N7488_001096 [Penicillium malachiteum]
MDGVLPGKTSAQFPDSTGPSEQPIVVIKLAMRSNHPLGVLHRHVRIVGKMFDRMMDELDNNSDHYEYLGANRYIANERATSNEIMILAYFRSYEGLHKFSHAPDGVHREAWNYWNKEIMGKGKTEEGRMFGINHEVFQAPAQRWESIYANYHPSGLGAATFKVTVDGKDKWANPLVDASRGLLRTSQGRMAVTAGDENEVYGEDPYVNGNDKI